MGNEIYDIKAAHPMSIKGIFNKYVLNKLFCSWGTLISGIITMTLVVLIIVILVQMMRILKNMVIYYTTKIVLNVKMGK